jgi:hypothetical protein
MQPDRTNLNQLGWQHSATIALRRDTARPEDTFGNVRIRDAQMTAWSAIHG